MSETIYCQAERRGRTWVVHVPEHGVYGHGRTLKAVHDNTVEGLALIGVTTPITLTPVTPELDTLRDAEAAYAKALNEAVAALALRHTTLGDIARATRAPRAQVKRLRDQELSPATPD